jgi:hypothetical protein
MTTVRDHFAVQALVGMLQTYLAKDEETWRVFDKRGWAKEAYEWADVMLGVRRNEEGVTITVRDYFAVRALVGLLQSPMYEEAWYEFDKRCWAKEAYEWADAMLAVGRNEEGVTIIGRDSLPSRHSSACSGRPRR